jgi:hypothetical protein
MKKFLTAGMALALGCGLTSVVFAEGQVAPPMAAGAAASAPTPATTTAKGTITSLDVTSAAPWIKLKNETGQELTLMIDPAKSSVWKTGKKAAWTDLKAGDMLKVRYTMKESNMILKTAEIQ